VPALVRNGGLGGETVRVSDKGGRGLANLRKGERNKGGHVGNGLRSTNVGGGVEDLQMENKEGTRRCRYIRLESFSGGRRLLGHCPQQLPCFGKTKTGGELLIHQGENPSLTTKKPSYQGYTDRQEKEITWSKFFQIPL